MVKSKNRIILFYNKVIRFLYRTYWLSVLSHSPIESIKFLIHGSKNIYSEFLLNVNGIRIKFRVIDSNVIEEIFIKKEYDFIKNHINAINQPIVLDIGAHIGAFSTWILANNNTARIVSIEADPDTFVVLAENKLSASVTKPDINWQIYNLLAWSSNDKLVNFSQYGPSMSHKVDPDGKIMVNSISLSKLFNILPIEKNEIDILKIDIEGSEEEFLCKNPELLGKVKCLIIELHPYLCNVENVLKVINEYFTNILEIKDRVSSKPLLYCRK